VGEVSTSELIIRRASIYGLTREKRSKKISNEWVLDNAKLSSRTYSILSTFLYKNLAILMNLFEIPRLERQEIRPPIHLEGGDPRKERAKAYVTSFIDTAKGPLILDGLRLCKDDVSFSTYAREMSQRFLETRFWPRTYLFLLQFSVMHSSFSEKFAAILTTKLQYGQLAEDARRVIDQIRYGVIGDTVKKAAIYPHIFEKNGKIESEPYIKVYEDNPYPAKYFYRFLRLEYPIGVQEFIEDLYNQELLDKGLPLDRFVDLLKEKYPDLLNQINITTIMNEITTTSSLSEFHDKIRFAKINDREYLLLVRGSNVCVLLGKNDLVKDGKIEFMDKSKLINKVLKGKSE